ncbi:MAG: NAD(P)-dependent oxidoreductase [Chitinophagaceae bacterium]|nr:NAD(P)-dependent oxidoreductase [Rubrivivax sp.]
MTASGVETGPAPARVGMLGLGIMGSAMSINLRAAGFKVVGFDPNSERTHDFERSGGHPARSARHVAEQCDVIVSVLPSGDALGSALLGAQGVLAAERPGIVLVESSTLDIDTKLRMARETQRLLTLLDCPISGTGAQAVQKDLLVYASGDRDALRRCEPVIAGYARSCRYAGAFGNGSKMKFVANLLVAIHNVAAAEALVFGMKAGLDAQDIYDFIRGGAGGSTMFSVRGPLMVKGDYEPATMKVQTWQKDMQIILGFAAALDCPTPLLSSCAPIYTAAMAQGRGLHDTASVCAVLEDAARLVRPARVTRPDA